MSNEARLRELLEEALESDRTPEQVCARNPELVGELRRRLEQWRLVRDELDILFPTTTSLKEEVGCPHDSLESLPAIHGYEVHSVLGHGGMGVVYKARHLALKRLVAVKMLLSGDYSRPSEKLRIRREAEALAKLSHPHIVQVHDVGEVEGRPYFTMEFMGGSSLKEKLGGAPQPMEYTVSMMMNLAGAVQAAHKHGIVHRDLKPANVLLTVDGVAKVSDFGLARQVEYDNLTLPGVPVGTPSYMAPEQASKKWGEVGCGADVYALGAILYEMMTGRPPFRGESAAETERQLLHEEVVAPSRLNARVPRDLETICLKCLRKDPAKRYGSAVELAEDLARFRNGEPIEARRVGRVERAFKWARRRPAAATAILATIMIVGIVGGAALWLASQRAAATRAAADDVHEAVLLQKNGDWDHAAAALVRAESRLRGGGAANWLRAELWAAQRDQDLFMRIDAARVGARSGLNGAPDAIRSVAGFERVLREFGFGTVADDPAVVGRKIKESNVRAAIVAALDDWSIFERDDRRMDWVTAVACVADPDPSGWRDDARRLRRGNKREAVRLAGKVVFADQPVAILMRVGQLMRSAGLDAVPFYRGVVQAHAGDPIANLMLGLALREKGELAEALEYLRVAATLRPRLFIARVELAQALAANGRVDEAIESLQEAWSADRSQWAYPQLMASLLLQAGRAQEALTAVDEAARLAPAGEPYVLSVRGTVLSALGRNEEALLVFRQAQSAVPWLTTESSDVRMALQRMGRFDEVRKEWQRALALNPPEQDAWDGYAELCLYLGDAGEYRKTCEQMLDKFGGSSNPRECERIGRACLLAAPSREDLTRATALIDRALSTTSAASPGYRNYFMVAKALADYRAGRYPEALAAVEGTGLGSNVLLPMPKLIAAMAHQQLGETLRAMKLLREAALAQDWVPQAAEDREAWMYHILRREAERMVIGELPAFLDGKYQPPSEDERIALTAVCQETARTAAEARLWEDVIKEEPGVAAGIRAKAIRAAALAGCGAGADVGSLDEEQRAGLRERARKWMEDELEVAEGLAGSDESRMRSAGVLMARNVRVQAGVMRDPGRLAQMSKEEREASEALFQRADRIVGDVHSANGSTTGRS